MGRHKEWRKTAKKVRRKRIRTAAAVLREEEEKLRQEKISSTAYYKVWAAEQEALELFRQEEEQRASVEANENWLRTEALAQEKWSRQQRMLLEEEEKRREQEARIKIEWEKEQEKERLVKEAKEREEEQKRLQYERLMEEMDSYITGSGAKPEVLYVTRESNPGRDPCPFFSKVGACRFRDSCTRNHLRPSVSSTILVPGFYSHFSLDVGSQGEYDTDIHLEFDHSERINHYTEFFHDVIPELEKFGRILQFRVCSNTEFHLRGNVYISYAKEREAAAAFKALNGRFYASKQLVVEFVDIPSWKNAICGLQYRGKCPKGSKCNFLHVFRNPRNKYSSFSIATNDKEKASPESDEDWRWTPSPERVVASDRSQRSKRSRTRSPRPRTRSSERSRRRRKKRDRSRSGRRRSRSSSRRSDRSSRSERSQHRKHKSRSRSQSRKT